MIHLYVLRLEGECYYVGITHNLNRRWAEHCGIVGNSTLFPGAKWTHLHKPIELIYSQLIPPSIRPTLLENAVMSRLMSLMGRCYVRGGNQCSVDRPPFVLVPTKSLLAIAICKQLYAKRLDKLILGDNPHYATI